MPKSTKKGGKKKLSKKKDKKDDGLDPAKFESLLFGKEFVPPAPLPFENLVELVTMREVNYRDVYDLRLPAHIVTQLTPQEIKDLQYVYNLCDVGLKEHLLPSEFINAMRLLGFSCSNEQTEEVFGKCRMVWKKLQNEEQKEASRESKRSDKTSISSTNDSHSAGGIPNALPSSQQKEGDGESWTLQDEVKFPGLPFPQFLEAVIAKQGSSFDFYEEILKGFEQFDLNGDGEVNTECMLKVAAQVGMSLSRRQAREMVDLADLDGNGSLSKPEFLRVMLQTNLYGGGAS